MPSPVDLERILNAIADPVFVKDRQHRWVVLNDACCRLIGANRATLIGKSDYDFFPKAEADIFWEKDEQVFATGLENDNDEQFTDTAGVVHYIITKKLLYESSAGEQFIVGCINDVTERNRMQQELQHAGEDLARKVHERTLELAEINDTLSKQMQEHERTSEQLRQSQKMEAIGQLAGGVAHDFNNLLGVIIGYGSMVKRWPDSDPKLLGVAQHIIDAAETAASLTRQLLAFSRKQVLQPETLGLNDVVLAVGNMLRHLIGEDIELEIKPGEEVGSIRVDRGQFEQVIINLAVNARDAMPTGGKLTIETSTADSVPDCLKGDDFDSQGYVAITVTDTGKGILPEVQTHIFEPFFTTKEQGKGTGLGLATVYGIVTQSNGRITVDSTPGAGTTFAIFLPGIEIEKTQDVHRHAEVLPQVGYGTILLVEDQQDLRALLREVLRSQGYTVLEASTGEEAVAVASDSQEIDMLVTDIVMPGMRGWELAQTLSARSPEIKILYISGHTDTDLINEGALLEGGTFLEKPFRPELLLRKVQEILRPTHY